MVDRAQAVGNAVKCTVQDPTAVGTTCCGKLAAVITATAVAAVVGGGDGGASSGSCLTSVAALIAAPGAMHGVSSPLRDSEVHQVPNGPS